MMITTPARAIKQECHWCLGEVRGRVCHSKICKLNDNTLPNLEKIRLYCLDCVETKQEGKDCTEKLLSEPSPCYLHPYRFGRNPKRFRDV
ncbi:MAG: hypothetical protein NG747_13295 [Candidatus Brocadia sp.]|nr:hypothetical protein [Candidatus Brocadia sp.]